MGAGVWVAAGEGRGVLLGNAVAVLGVALTGAPDGVRLDWSTVKGALALCVVETLPRALTFHTPGRAVLGTMVIKLKRPCASAATLPRLIALLLS